MTKRQETRTDRRILTRARRTVTTAVLAAVLAATGTTTGAAPAEAAVPTVAQTYSVLMWRSLTANETKAALYRTLAAQRAAVTTRTAEAATAAKALAAAEKQVTAAEAADTDARARVDGAREALATAKRNLRKVKKRNKSAYTRARNAVTAAEKTFTARISRVRETATALATARSTAADATTARDDAAKAVTAATAVVAATEKRIAGLQTPAYWAAQAATLSRQVVTTVRPQFTIDDTRIVHGTRVHRSVAYAYLRMVEDAKKAGIPIAGGGFRTKQRQIELRKINGCPDIWTAPASSCRVPTAIPGRSLHEIGMAVDITSGGKSLTSKSRAFKWLKIHADEYGFVNLPSEPWHWSVTGG